MTFRTTVQDGQILLPTRLRVLAGVANGDPVEITFTGGSLIVTPGRATVREPERKSRKPLLAKFAVALEDLRADAERKGVNRRSLRQINAGIAAARKERRAKEAFTQPTK